MQFKSQPLNLIEEKAIKLNPYELHPEDRDKMDSKMKKDKLEVSKVKKIISSCQKEYRKRKLPLWGYNKSRIDEIFESIIRKIEKEVNDDS